MTFVRLPAWCFPLSAPFSSSIEQARISRGILRVYRPGSSGKPPRRPRPPCGLERRRLVRPLPESTAITGQIALSRPPEPPHDCATHHPILVLLGQERQLLGKV